MRNYYSTFSTITTYIPTYISTITTFNIDTANANIVYTNQIKFEQDLDCFFLSFVLFLSKFVFKKNVLHLQTFT